MIIQCGRRPFNAFNREFGIDTDSVQVETRQHHLHMGFFGSGAITVHHRIDVGFEVAADNSRSVDDQFHLHDILHLTVFITLHQIDPHGLVSLVRA